MNAASASGTSAQKTSWKRAGSIDTSTLPSASCADALARAALGGATAAQARVHVAEIDAAVHAPEPDKRRAARPLKRLVELLANAGSLATAGAALIGPLQTLAGWLGAHGAAILGLLAL